MCLFSLNSTRLLISGRNPNCENRSVCKCRDIYFRDSVLLNLRQGIVGLYASSFERLANQNACYKKVALELLFVVYQDAGIPQMFPGCKNNQL